MVLLAGLALVPAGITETLNGSVGYQWQVEIERAASWGARLGPDATYGAFDAGLVGYRLHGTHALINLDGLMNDNEFVEWTDTPRTRLEIARHEGVEILVNDMPVGERQGDLACATTLWEGQRSLRADASTENPDRMYVLDLRPCG